MESLTVERIGQGRGFAGSIHRLTIRYSADTEAPPTIVVKSPSANLEIRDYAIRDGMYRRETMFYRELATESGIPVPDCYFSDLDPESGDFVLLLEDLTGKGHYTKFPERAEENLILVTQLPDIE